MRFSRPLLIAPYYRSSYYGGGQGLTPPIGLGYVAETLRANGIGCDFLDRGLFPDLEALEQRIRDRRPDILGISLMTFRYKEAYAWITEIKRRHPEIPICLGGPHVSSFRTRLLEECPAIDYGVVLEGEEPFLELCRGDELSSIRNLLYREDGRICYTGDRPLRRDLDAFPFPRYRGFELKNYTVIGVSTSRGCPYQCIFCESSVLMGKSFRARAAQSVVEEFAHWYAAGYRRFSLNEDNFTVDRGRVHEICSGLKARGLTDIRIEANNVRADNLDEGVLRSMYEAGMRSLCLGVESGSETVLQTLKKGESLQCIREAIRLGIKLGYEVKLYFIVGSPGETWSDFMRSVRLALEFPVRTVKFYSSMPVPGTELYEIVRRDGRFTEDAERFLSERNPFHEEPFFDHPSGMTLEEKRRALRHARLVVHQVELRYRLKRFGPVVRLLIDLLFLPIVYPLWRRGGILRRLFDR